MSYTDSPVTVATYTAGDYRARVSLDTAPSEPEDDGSFPILCFERDSVRELNVTSYRLPSLVLEAAHGIAREGQPLDLFARLLRIFHGSTTCTTWQHPEDHRITYVAFDTAAWREFVGVDAGPDLVATMGDWEHYVNGDVFDVVVEKRDVNVTMQDVHDAVLVVGATVPHVDVMAEAHRLATERGSHCWDNVDITGGHYGDEWARQAAREALADYSDDEITEVA